MGGLTVHAQRTPEVRNGAPHEGLDAFLLSLTIIPEKTFGLIETTDQHGFPVANNPAHKPLSGSNPGIHGNAVPETEPCFEGEALFLRQEHGHRIGIEYVAYDLGEIIKTCVTIHCLRTKRTLAGSNTGKKA